MSIVTIPKLLFGITLLIGVAVLCWFVAALARSGTEGEIAGALGSLIGGIIGAGGAVLAVYLALSSQRNEEAARSSDAVRTEVTTYAKYVIGGIEVCQQIANGTVRIPRQDARYVAKSFWADPIVYSAVADKIGLLPHPNATVEFYMRLSEARSMLEALRTRTNPESAIYVAPPPEFITPEFAASVADSLITALQLARAIIGDEIQLDSGKPHLGTWIKITVVRQIDQCLESAKLSFPNAESFQQPAEKQRAWSGLSGINDRAAAANGRALDGRRTRPSQASAGPAGSARS